MYYKVEAQLLEQIKAYISTTPTGNVPMNQALTLLQELSKLTPEEGEPEVAK